MHKIMLGYSSPIDRVFQALANARLTEPQKSDLAAHLEAAGAPAEAIATMATIDADGGVFGVEMEDMPFLGNLASAKERETLAGILTEEQMAVYDQRRGGRQGVESVFWNGRGGVQCGAGGG